MRSTVKRLLAVVAVLVMACTRDKATAPEAVGRVSITPATSSVEYGQTVQLAATVAGASGAVLTSRAITWSSSNEAVATVSTAGVVTAGAVRGGTAETVVITATSEGKSGSTTLAIQPIAVATVIPSLTQFTIAVGETTPLAVTLKDVTGETLTGRPVTWSSSAPSIATVSGQGLVTALANGTATITAAVQGKTAVATVTVASKAGVQFGASVDAATRARVVGFVTARDSVGTASNRVALPDTAATAVLAINAKGEAILAGTASPSASASIDAASTATLLVRLLLPPDAATARGTSLNAAISQTTEFPALVEAIRNSAGRAESFAKPQTVALASSVVSKLIAASNVTARNERSALGLLTAPGFSRYTDVSYSVGGAAPGATITFVNSAFIPLDVSAGGRGVQLERRGACVLCLPPSVGLKTSASIIVGADGPVNLTAVLTRAERERMIFQAAVDLAGGILRIAGFTLNSADNGLLLSALGTKIDLQSLLVKPSFTDALQSLNNAAIAAAPEIATRILERYPNNFLSSLLGSVLRQLLLPLAAFDTAVWVADRYVTYSDVVRYWLEPLETVTACLDAGRMYDACVSTVTVTPGAGTLTAGGPTSTFVARAIDTKGSTVTDRTITWSSSDDATASVSNGVVTPKREGTVTIRASAGGVTGSTTVTIQPAEPLRAVLTGSPDAITGSRREVYIDSTTTYMELLCAGYAGTLTFTGSGTGRVLSYTWVWGGTPGGSITQPADSSTRSAGFAFGVGGARFWSRVKKPLNYQPFTISLTFTYVDNTNVTRQSNTKTYQCN
jgi:uncharacterized protein YjdB